MLESRWHASITPQKASRSAPARHVRRRLHGRTLATIAAGGQAKYLEGFGPKVEGFDQVPFDDWAALEAAIGPETAGILIEPVQGEGGLRPVAPSRMRKLREICDANGMLLGLDEVQCGIGRTGKLFAYEWSGISPDIMAIAKGIGGGFPMGACLATENAARGMTAGTHGSTFGGNPLAMAVGNAVLDVVLADGFLDHVRRAGLTLKQRLAQIRDEHPTIIAEVRGEGLMMGLKCKVRTPTSSRLHSPKSFSSSAPATMSCGSCRPRSFPTIDISPRRRSRARQGVPLA